MANDSSTGGFLSPISSLPSEDAALDLVLQALVVGVVGLPGNLVRPRWQEVPPTQPEAGTDWVAIGVTEEDPEPNISLIHNAAGDGSSTSIDVDIITVLASFYGPNAAGNAIRLRSGLMQAQNREILQLNNMGLIQVSGRTRTASLIQSRFMDRFDVRMSFSREVREFYPVRYLLHVPVQITTDTGVVTNTP